MNNMTTTHEMARIFIARYGTKAALEIKRREQKARQSGKREEVEDWRRIRQSLETVKGPPVS